MHLDLSQLAALAATILGIPGGVAGVVAYLNYRTDKKTRLEKELDEAEKRGEEKGKRESWEAETTKAVKAAHDKIREAVMPKIEELERSQDSLKIQLDTIQAGQTEMKEMLIEIVKSSTATAQAVAYLNGAHSIPTGMEP